MATQTSKSHKSRKTELSEPASRESSSVPVKGPSSLVPAIAESSVPSNNITSVMTTDAHSVPDTQNTGIMTIVPKKQWWYRPKDSKARKIVAKIMVLRAAGHQDGEIAKRLKTTAGSVAQYVYVARKNGWLDAEDEPVDLEAELAMDVDRKVVRNIGSALDGQMTNWQTHEMTLAAAKGRGIFKTHEVNKNDGTGPMPLVAIQVVMPPVGAGDQLPEIHEDQMGGLPAYLEGDVDGETGTPSAVEADS